MATSSHDRSRRNERGLVDMGIPNVRIIHETNPEKYFPALFELDRQQRIDLVGSHRYSVLKEWFRSWRRERTTLRHRARHLVQDIKLRAQLFTIKGEVIVLGFAPWDWRMAIYAILARRNSIIYHTSWPYWGTRETPRQYGPLTPLFRLIWLRVLNHPNVHVVAVLRATHLELLNRHGISAEVIPHAVPRDFFSARRTARREPQQPLRLIFVGELTQKKGIHQLFKLMESLTDDRVVLTVVGDGPLRERCIEAASMNPSITFVGPIRDRIEMARIMAKHDLLILLSQRERDWEELFGIVIAEAMAAGLGVAASNHIGPRSLLEAAQIGNLFDDNDLNGAIELIGNLAAERDDLGRFRAAHLDLADAFRLPAVADQWARLITSLAEEALQYKRSSPN